MVMLSAASDMGAIERFSKINLQWAGSPFLIFAGMIRVRHAPLALIAPNTSAAQGSTNATLASKDAYAAPVNM
jgi:hypothetical protein